MEIEGTVIAILPEVNGQGKNGTWRKQEFVLETQGQYPKKICVAMWGEKIEQFALTIGDAVVASVDLESREYNQRWYTEVKTWKVEKSGSMPGPSNEPGDFGPPPNPSFAPSEADDDLPF
jgi:hypothetical protein